MWFDEEVVFPRFMWSLCYTIFTQQLCLSLFFLVLKIISWFPFSESFDWLSCLFHWKTVLSHLILCISTVAFSLLNRKHCSLKQHICSSRLEKIKQILSLSSILHFLTTAFLGSLTAFCFHGLFNAYNVKNSFLAPLFMPQNGFELFFIVLHGCYSGIMFSLKYFVCSLYILKFTANESSLKDFLWIQIEEVLKDSVYCVVSSLHCYCLFFMILSPVMENALLSIGIDIGLSESLVDLIYKMADLKIFAFSIVSGVAIFFTWSLHLAILNACALKHHIFPIEVAAKDKEKTLLVALKNTMSVSHFLAVMDLRLLAMKDIERRKQIFAISKPGGHPHNWNAVSEFCVATLSDFLLKLQEYAAKTAAKGVDSNKNVSSTSFYSFNQSNLFETQNSAANSFVDSQISFIDNRERTLLAASLNGISNRPKTSSSSFRQWFVIAYFLDELPTTQIRQIFASSQPLIWIIDALGYLLAASYTEDTFGVVQKSLPSIICLLLNLKMAEEKLTPEVIRSHVRDPQGRYEHIHQRAALKNALNSALGRIATAFRKDIQGINLPEEYYLYYQRFLKRNNL